MLKCKMIQFFILFTWISSIAVWTQTVPVNESDYQGKIRVVDTGKYGGLKIPAVFSDHMVLQRDIPITIWGTADFNEKIEVTLASNKAECSAGSDGKWVVKIPPMPAGGPYILTISGQTTFEFRDVLIGEVWLCSGQSNMAFPLESEENASSEIPQANFPEIRLFNMQPSVRTGNITFSEKELLSINNGDYFEFGPWEKCTPESSRYFSAVAYYFGKYLYQQLNVPIGLINNAIGGSNTESWISRGALEAHPWLADLLTDWRNNELVSEWCRERAAKNLEMASTPYQRHPFEPTYLFDAGIAPVIRYGIRGVIWYQGESNADNIPVHNELFPLLVSDWREHWDLGNFPFLYLQLSSIEERKSWPEFRDSQRRFMKLIPNCGMAVTSDIGHPTDVHPKNKEDVGERLALWALAKAYEQDVVFSGPIYSNYFIKHKKMILTFDYTGSGLTTRDHDEITGFEITGKGGMFKPADAKIKNDRIILFNKTIPEPVQVRYAWEPFTKANLINNEGLPASTFITDLNEK